MAQVLCPITLVLFKCVFLMHSRASKRKLECDPYAILPHENPDLFLYCTEDCFCYEMCPLRLLLEALQEITDDPGQGREGGGDPK